MSIEDDFDAPEDGLDALLDALGDDDLPGLQVVGGPDCFALVPRRCATIEEWESQVAATLPAPPDERPQLKARDEGEPRPQPRGPRVIRI